VRSGSAEMVGNKLPTLRDLDKTEVLPPDVDGRVPTPLHIEFKPR